MTMLNKIDPLGHGPGVRTKILFDMFYILFVGWHIKFGIKSLKLTWLLKFNDIWPLDPYSGPQGGRQKLEDLKVLRRSPDLLNNVKIGQGQLQFLMEQILFLPYTFWSSDLNNLMNNPSNSPVISEKKMFR